MTCHACGAEVTAAELYCGECGARQVAQRQESSGRFTPPSLPADAPIDGPRRTEVGHHQEIRYGVLAGAERHTTMTTSVSEVQLAKGEQLKATYPITRIHRPLGWLEAYVIVTDARVIYRAQALNRFNRSVSNQEVQIDKISGLQLNAKRGITPLAGATILLIDAMALLVILLLHTTVWPLLLGLIATGLIAFLGRRATFIFQFSGDSSNEQISFGGGMKDKAPGIIRAIWALLLSPVVAILSLLGLLDARRVEIAGLDITGENRRLLDETVRTYEEMGSLILEIQSSGTLATSRVKRNPGLTGE